MNFRSDLLRQRKISRLSRFPVFLCQAFRIEVAWVQGFASETCAGSQLSVRELWGFQVGQGDVGFEENIITSKPNAA